MRRDLPDTWSRRRLAECGTWLSGGTPAKSNPDYWGGEIPWVGPKDLHVHYVDDAEEYVSEAGVGNGTRTVPEHTILIVVRSMALAKRLQIAFTKRQVAFNQDVKAILPADGVHPRFLFYALWGSHDALHSLVDEASHGTKRLRTDALSQYEIPVPPLSEQERIASVLSALDDKIGSNRTLRSVSDETAAELFRASFDRNATERTPIGKLIEDHVLYISDGLRAKNSELAADGLPFARARNLNDGFDFTSADRVPESVAGAVRAKCSAPGDVVFTSKGTVGRFAFVDPWIEPFVYSPQLCFWRSLDHDRLPPVVLFWWMQGTDAKRQLDALKGQTDMADYVSLRDQRSMTMPLPQRDTIRPLAAALDPLAMLSGALRAETRTLAEVRDALLPKLISGEIRVSDTVDPLKVIEPAAESIAVVS